MQEPITGQGKPTPDANSALLVLFLGHIQIWQLQLFPIQETFQLDQLAVTKLFCLLSFSFIPNTHPPPPPPPLSRYPFRSVTPSVCESGCLFASHGKRTGKWFSVASDFHYLFSIRPLISERKSNMWRESDRQRPSLGNRAIVHSRSAFKHEGPSNSFSKSPLSLSRAIKQAHLCSNLCCSQLLLLICAATEGKYFITFFKSTVGLISWSAIHAMKGTMTCTFNYNGKKTFQASEEESFCFFFSLVRAHWLNDLIQTW